MDTQVLALASALKLCLTNAVTGNPGSPPLSNICYRLDLQVAHDADLYDDLCCEGLAYVSFGDIYPVYESTDINTARQMEPCSPPAWGVNLRAGIIRCVPVGTDTTMPTCQEWADSFTQAAHDAQALRATACCFRSYIRSQDGSGPFWGMGVVVGHQSQVQLQGGCVERNVQIAVQIPNCDCGTISI